MPKENKVLYDANSKIPSEEFTLVHESASIHDAKFETKPVGWLKDSMSRFAKNKMSVIAAVILALIALFAIIVPLASPKSRVSGKDFPSGFQDSKFAEVLPRLSHNMPFWNGTKVVTIGENDYQLHQYDDSNYQKYTLISKQTLGNPVIGFRTVYKVREDTYAVGVSSGIKVNKAYYDELVAYEAKKGISMSTDFDKNLHRSILKPQIDYKSYVEGELVTLLTAEGVSPDSITSIQDKMKNYYHNAENAYIYYKLFPAKRGEEYVDTSFVPYLNNEGKIEDIYVRDTDNKLVYYTYENGEYSIRVDYYDYFTYRYGFKNNYLLGSNNFGQDILLRLAKGTRFSLLLGIGVSLINFIIGLIWGAVSGYYGGKVDLIMERVTDIIANVPTIIIMSIASIQLTNNMAGAGAVVLSFLIAFVYNGWVGVASTTRMQFYRFKGQEYVLASRTLGAKDRRLIFKHILPNAAGTLVTASVLMIPGIIFSESSLSYLGIVDFTSSGIDTIGVLLKEGQSVIKSSPHVLISPVIFIAILMICFNLFGNGLRDAFNTTLRGSED
ncbi:MAG: ABC transporter permease [Bacilli bacterium]|nr:ABC transporter permease [Bacilli bacterium]